MECLKSRIRDEGIGCWSCTHDWQVVGSGGGYEFCGAKRAHAVPQCEKFFLGKTLILCVFGSEQRGERSYVVNKGLRDL